MTVACQKAQQQLGVMKEEKDSLVKEVQDLQEKCSENERELKDLKIEIKTHNEAMTLLGDASSVEQSNDNGERDEELQKLQNQLSTEKSIRDKQKASHSAESKEKNAEIRQLKSTIAVLENNVVDAQGNADKYQALLDASELEKERLQQINGVLAKKANRIDESSKKGVKLVGLKCDPEAFS